MDTPKNVTATASGNQVTLTWKNKTINVASESKKKFTFKLKGKPDVDLVDFVSYSTYTSPVW